MSDLTPDQRLSAKLLPVLGELQEHSATSNRNAEILRTNGKPEAASVQATLERRADEVTERLADIIEALAAGTLRIVDEGRLVRVLVAEFETPTEAPDTTGRAQLALEQMRFMGAIR